MKLVDSALHEAAHCVIARALGLDVSRLRISVTPRGANGTTEIEHRHRVKPGIQALVAAAPAAFRASLGFGAEEPARGDQLVLESSGTDVEAVDEVVAAIVAVPEVREAVGRVTTALLAVLDLPRAAVIGLVGPEVRTAVIRALRVKKIRIDAELAA